MAPFMASTTPPRRTSGRHQASSRSSGATAREVTTSNRRLPWSSSARPRTTSTLSSAEVRDHLLEEGGPPQQRLDQGHAQVGAADRQHEPGQAGPAPDVATVRRSATSVGSTAQLRRCRSHSRGTSRGPISPRSTPRVASSSAYRSASGSRQRTPPPPRRAAGVFHVKRRRSSSVRRAAPRRNGVGSTPSESETRPAAGHHVVDDLALERRHRLERDRLAGLLAPARSRRAASPRGPCGAAARCPPMSSISRERSPVSRSTASRVSSCSASSTSPSRPTSRSRSPPTIETAARSPSTSMSRSPSRSAMSRSSSR